MNDTRESKENSLRLQDFCAFIEYQTRWNDNDQYGHLNNSVYHFLFDTVINKYLIEHCSLTPTQHIPNSSASPPEEDSPIGLVVNSQASFYRPLTFPDRLLLGMRVVYIGTSSVRYEVGVFGPLKNAGGGSNRSRDRSSSDYWASLLDDPTPAVVGGFTHVFVDRKGRKPVGQMPKELRTGLEAGKREGVQARL